MGIISVNVKVTDNITQDNGNNSNVSIRQAQDNNNNSNRFNNLAGIEQTTATTSTTTARNLYSTNMGSDNNSESAIPVDITGPTGGSSNMITCNSSTNNNTSSVRNTTSRSRSRSLSSNNNSPGGLSLLINNNHESSTGASSTSSTGSCKTRFCTRIISIRSIADVVATKISIFDTILYNGTMVGVGLLGVYCIVLIIVWIPLYCITYITSEIGLYILLVLVLVTIGRFILRLLAFPTATSSKIKLDIETEFCNYSIRILSTAFQSIQDITSTILCVTNNSSTSISTISQSNPIILDSRVCTIVSNHWYRCTNLRNRVINVYYEVLVVLYGQQQQSNDSSTIVHDLTLQVEETVTTLTAAVTSSSSSNNQTKDQVHQHQYEVSFLNRYGNNRIIGDIGHYAQLSKKTQTDGRELMNRLQTILQLMDDFEKEMSSTRLLFTKGQQQQQQPVYAATISTNAYQISKRLFDCATEAKDFLSSLKSTSNITATNNNDDNDGSNNNDENDTGDNDTADNDTTAATRSSNQQSQQRNVIKNIQTGLSSIGPLLDPLPHDSILGLDVQRGCVLCRYYGSKQFWVNRHNNTGMIDVMHFPGRRMNNNSTTSTSIGKSQPRTAVLYCNPNAGLIEIAAGIGLTGGNVVSVAEVASPGATPQRSNNQRTATAEDNWIDYYTELGIDVYIYNYAGYGRSYGTTGITKLFGRKWGYTSNGVEPISGIGARLRRIFHSIAITFQPTSQTLRSDGIAVAEHIIQQQNTSSTGSIERLIIHGESIGGMAAAGIAQHLTSTSTIHSSGQVPPILLLCDRTFCNLEALAQRLVGSWSGYAIRLIAPKWNMDVANDFLSVPCPKIVASDSSDAIIHDAASLKSGIALYTELYQFPQNHKKKNTTTTTVTNNGISNSNSTQIIPSAITKHLGWVQEVPLMYRMAEYENVNVAESKFYKSIQTSHQRTMYNVPQNPPVWPQDKHVTIDEATHFAACCKRIAKYARQVSSRTRKRASSRNIPSDQNDDTTTDINGTDDIEVGIEGISMTTGWSNNNGGDRAVQSPSNAIPIIVQIWLYLGCCDGLNGMTLGYATKQSGYDIIIVWLCSLCTFGSQVVISRAEKRISGGMNNNKQKNNNVNGQHPDGLPTITIDKEDFDLRPKSYQHQEMATQAVFPKPIPDVIDTIQKLLHENVNDTSLIELKREIQYVLGMFQYVLERLQSSSSINTALSSRKLGTNRKRDDDRCSSSSSSRVVGTFLNLHCGHNVAYSDEERKQLQEFITIFIGSSSSLSQHEIC